MTCSMFCCLCDTKDPWNICTYVAVYVRMLQCMYICYNVCTYVTVYVHMLQCMYICYTMSVQLKVSSRCLVFLILLQNVI